MKYKKSSSKRKTSAQISKKNPLAKMSYSRKLNKLAKKANPSKRLQSQKKKIYLPTAAPIKKKKTSLNDNVISKLSNINSIEEFYHLTTILDNKNMQVLIENSKNKNTPQFASDKINYILKKSSSIEELNSLLKQELLGELHKEYLLLSSRLKKLKNKGVDIYIESLKLSTIPHKIKMFSLTYQKNDYYILRKIYHEIYSLIEEKGNL
jgi:hypothetical protein